MAACIGRDNAEINPALCSFGEQQGASRELKAETSLAAIPRRGFPGRILTTRTLTSVRRAVLSKNTGPAIPGSGGVTV